MRESFFVLPAPGGNSAEVGLILHNITFIEIRRAITLPSFCRHSDLDVVEQVL
jgi:hypothetical protein